MIDGGPRSLNTPVHHHCTFCLAWRGVHGNKSSVYRRNTQMQYNAHSTGLSIRVQRSTGLLCNAWHNAEQLPVLGIGSHRKIRMLRIFLRNPGILLQDLKMANEAQLPFPLSRSHFTVTSLARPLSRFYCSSLRALSLNSV